MITIKFTDTSGMHQNDVPIPSMSQDPNDSLDCLFSLSRMSIEATQRSIDSQQWPNFTVGWGKLSQQDIKLIKTIYDCAKQMYPVNIQAPFEGSQFIAGGVWAGSELDDALVPLQFSPGCNDLPPHTHRYSDRLIVILAGQGKMYYSRSASSQFSENDFEAREISTGDVIVFMRGTIHTFTTDHSALQMLSYHAPFIPLEDSKQYEVVGSVSKS